MKLCKDQYKLKTTMLLPERIVLSENTLNAEVLLEEHCRQSILGAESVSCKIKKGGYIILDFGEEIQGGIVVSIQNPSDRENGKIHFVFGESVSEAQSTIGEKNSVNDHSIRDLYYPVTIHSTFRIGNTGFRFVKIEACETDICLSEVQAAYEHCGLEQKGSFRCSDERINKIFNVSVKTVYLCMQEYLWDGIKRDRLIWLGDMHPEVSVICSVFGDAECVPRSLDEVSRFTPKDKWINTLPSYSFQWIRVHYLWYMQTGDIEYLKKQKDYINSIIKKADSYITENGEITIEDKFVDWSSRYTEYEAAGLRAIILMAVREAKEMLISIKDNSGAKLCEKVLQKLVKKCEKYDGNKQITALCVLAGLCDAEREGYQIIAKDRAKGLSTFLGYYTLCAISEAGNTAFALDVIKEYWGAMIDLGATTFWEDFDIDWIENAAPIDEPVPEGKKDIHGDFGKHCYTNFRHSLCHGWSAGPAAYLMKYVLGVNICEPGCRKIKITPNMGKLKFAEGSYPTPYGPVRIRHENKYGKIMTTVDAPKEIDIIYNDYR